MKLSHRFSRLIPIILLITAINSNCSSSEDQDTSQKTEKFDEYYDKGLKSYEEQKWTKAIEYFNKAKTLDPTKGEIYVKLAHSYKNIGHYVESIRAFEKAEALKTPLVYEDYFALAFNYNNIKQYDKAVEAFNKTIQINPDGEYSVYLALATSYYNLKKYKEAIPNYKKAIDRNNRLEDAHYYMARSYEKQKKYDEALRAAEFGLKRNPNSEKLLDLTAWYLVTVPVDNLRNGKKALRLAERTVDFTDSLDPLYLETLAAAYAETGDFEKALQIQQKSVDLAISYDYDEAKTNEFKARLESYKNKKPWRLN